MVKDLISNESLLGEVQATGPLRSQEKSILATQEGLNAEIPLLEEQISAVTIALQRSPEITRPERGEQDDLEINR